MDCPAGSSDWARRRGLGSKDILRLGQCGRAWDQRNQGGGWKARQPLRGQDLRERSRVQRFITKAPAIVARLAVVVRVRHGHSDMAVLQAVQGTHYCRLNCDEARQHQDSHNATPGSPGHVVSESRIKGHDKKVVQLPK